MENQMRRRVPQLRKKVLAFHVVLWYYKWALDLKNAICADSSTG